MLGVGNEMKVKSAIAVLFCFSVFVSSAREWVFTDGHVIEAEYRKILFDDVVLELADGEELKVPLDQLSEFDRNHVQLLNPPTLDIELARKSRQRSFPPTYGGGAPPESTYCTFFAKIKQVSSRQMLYDHPLTLEFFALGEEIGADKRVLLDRKVKTFTLSEENNYRFICNGREVQMLDYNINAQRRGTRYGGYLVVIRDVRGEIIAHKGTSKSLYQNLSNLSKIKAGWYFDDECNRCLPTPPQPWPYLVRQGL